VMALKRALRNGSITVDHSFSHRVAEEKLIPLPLWQRSRARFTRGLNLPASPEKYIQRLEAGLSAGLAALAEAVKAGAVAVEHGELRLPRRKPVPRDPRVDPARETLAIAVGNAQIPEVIIEIDHLSRFSWTLLGRPARSERELVTLYAGLIGLGSDLSAAELVRMVPALAADSLGQMVLRIEADGRLRAANDAVLRFMRGRRIAGLWGRGLFASADMMSLEATRYLWAARLDPRRRTYAVGTYAHVLDQWGILYDQPIVLNRRQAGPAIEGALRQQHVDRLERVAVDTHGFTHFAMALAKLVGFDLCPRLARLKKRKLYLPRGLDVPEGLRPCVVETVSRRAIARGWEGLLRLGASVKHGWYPATEALDRFGSAAVGDPVYEAGDSLGKLVRTLYLCDYFGNPVFRTEILDLLNQGEAVHSLQRAVYDGMITAKHGRTMEELGAISGALTLLANIVMAWNTHQLQIAIDRAPADLGNQFAARPCRARRPNKTLLSSQLEARFWDFMVGANLSGGRRPRRLFLRALRLRLGAQLHELLQPRARKDVRPAVGRARPGEAQEIGLGDRPPAAGRRCPANHLSISPGHLPLPPRARHHGDGQQHLQRLAVRGRSLTLRRDRSIHFCA
jgi:TnpA family transposase